MQYPLNITHDFNIENHFLVLGLSHQILADHTLSDKDECISIWIGLSVDHRQPWPTSLMSYQPKGGWLKFSQNVENNDPYLNTLPIINFSP